MIRHFIRKVHGESACSAIEMNICVPSGSDVSRTARDSRCCQQCRGKPGLFDP
jgi:hypothetical protein